MPHVSKTWTQSVWLSVAETVCTGLCQTEDTPLCPGCEDGWRERGGSPCVKQDVAGQMLIGEGAHGARSIRCAHI